MSNKSINSQIISPELRKLAVSVNQFGIDALRALDRTEPANKVLVFCPVCVSSSLSMIMMGSSKYQVVSSLRQALYVWSMKPDEINKGYRDIFEHLELNQPSSFEKENALMKPTVIKAQQGRTESINFNPRSKREIYHSVKYKRIVKPTNFYHHAKLSLSQLMHLKELLDTTEVEDAHPWWYDTSRDKSPTMNMTALSKAQTLRNERFFQSNLVGSATADNEAITLMAGNRRVLGDMSQMSALSNIYIQRGLTMNYSYNLLLRMYFKTVIHPVDFLRNWDETRKHINSLVASGIEGKVKDLIKRTNFEQNGKPKIMMISTFHFRGTLDIAIKSTRLINVDKSNKWSGAQNKSSSFIETEETLMKYGRFPEIGCTTIEIPFNNRLVSLIIVMPIQTNTTGLLLTKLSAQVLMDMVHSLSVKKLSIEIPVIKFDRGPINMEGLLKELGLTGLFYRNEPYSTESGLNRWLRPSDIVHETSIDIGTINPRFSQTEDRLKVGAHENMSTGGQEHLKLDKPFFYFVLDSLNGLVLTMGRIGTSND